MWLRILFVREEENSHFSFPFVAGLTTKSPNSAATDSATFLTGEYPAPDDSLQSAISFA